MMHPKTLGAALLSVVLAGAGCAPQGSTANSPTRTPTPAKAGGTKETAAHTHGKGPNGGVVFDLGKYHAEFTVDHDKKECTVLVLGADEKTPTPVAAKELTVITMESKTKQGVVVPSMTIKMLPKDEANGKASKFVGTDP